MNGSNVDVLIIGAGPSGCVAASYLHNNGIKIKVVEKNKFPRFVVGESLLPRCMDHFEEAGLLDCLKRKGFEVKSGARFIKDNVHCDFDFSKKHTDGWNWTWQVPRADFDKTLTDELLQRSVDIVFETEVVNVVFANDGSSTTTIKDVDGNKSEVNAKYIIDSSGYGRVLPRLLDLDKKPEMENQGAIFTHVIDENRPKDKEGTLITFDVIDTATWLWVIPFSNGVTSLGYVGTLDFLDSYKGSTTEKFREMLKLSEHYSERFKGLEYLFEPREIKGYAKSVKQLYGKGYALTGNSAEFLDPVFSSGVTFATESALLAAKLFVKELKGEKVDWETDYSDYIKEGVAVFATYVREWYSGNLQTLFFYRPENPEVKKQICAVLAGYVWDRTNPFVTKRDRLIKTIAKFLEIEKSVKESEQ